ncbi:MAG: DUF4019 domain-containing protein [Pseudoxanthomonas sp.]
MLLTAVLTGCTVNGGNKQQDEELVNMGTIEQQKPIIETARSIAELFDQAEFDKAWASTGPMLRAKTDEQTFAAGVRVFRSALGLAGRREVRGFNFPKAADGVQGDSG